MSFNKSLGSRVIEDTVSSHLQKCTVLLREIVGELFTTINFWEYGNKEKVSLAIHKKVKTLTNNNKNLKTHKFYNIMHTFQCLISAQCIGYWLQKQRNMHRITSKQSDNTWGGRQQLGEAGLSSSGAALQNQPGTGFLPFCWPGSGHSKAPFHLVANPNEIPGLQHELIPHFKNFSVVKRDI